LIELVSMVEARSPRCGMAARTKRIGYPGIAASPEAVETGQETACLDIDVVVMPQELGYLVYRQPGPFPIL
jgi:hypothetical protein